MSLSPLSLIVFPVPLRYALLSGDGGIVRTLDVPLYVVTVRGSSLFCLNREAAPVEVREIEKGMDGRKKKYYRSPSILLSTSSNWLSSIDESIRLEMEMEGLRGMILPSGVEYGEGSISGWSIDHLVSTETGLS